MPHGSKGQQTCCPSPPPPLPPRHSVLSLFRQHQASFVCWLVGCLASQQHVRVSQGRICSDNFLRKKLQTKLSISPSHSILTPGQPLPALTLCRHTPGRVAATGVPVFKSLVSLNPEKSPSQTRFELRIFRS